MTKPWDAGSTVGAATSSHGETNENYEDCIHFDALLGLDAVNDCMRWQPSIHHNTRTKRTAT